MIYNIIMLLNVVSSSKTGHAMMSHCIGGEIKKRDTSFSELYLHLCFSLLRLPLYGKF